jgi:hypothetical protein
MVNENPNVDPKLNTPLEFHEAHHARLGPILGVLILILALILGGLFLWGSMLAEKEAPMLPPIVNNEPETPRAEADAQIFETTSPSDDLGAIEADIESTNLDLLDQDMQAIDSEFNTSYEVQ